MPRVLFQPAARLELIEAQDFYERAAQGLGARFRAQVDEQARRIEAHPLQFPKVYEDVRRVRLRRFPYALFYLIEPDAIYVLACFHASRDPRIWQARA